MKDFASRAGALLCLLALSLCTMAQTKKQFTLEDLIYGGTNFWNLQPENTVGYTAWWGDRLIGLDTDGCRVLTDTKGRYAEPRTDESDFFVRTADINALLDSASQGKVRHLMNASFPYADKQQLMVSTARCRLLYDWKEKRIVWTQPLKAGRSNTDFCKASRCEAYVKDWNLYVLTADGRELQVSADGTRELQYGRSVHRDEFGISKGTFWSPKGTLLAFYRMDQTMVTDYPQVDIAPTPAELDPDKYPMAGQTSHKVTVGIFNTQTQRTVYLQAGDPTDRYFTNISWSPDEKIVYMFELPRSQDKAELVAYDAATGERKGVLYTETHEKYVEPQNPITFLPWDSSKFLLQSQRDGFNHLYLFDVAKGEQRQLTKGSFVVGALVGFNEAKRSVIIKANGQNPICWNYYSVDVKSGRCTLLDSGEGNHQARLSGSGAFLFDVWNSPSVARRTDLLRTDKQQVNNLASAAEPWAGYNVPEIKGGSIKAADGSTDLYYRLILPTNFDATKKYPTVIYVYGGPHARLVDGGRNYGASGWEFYMAQLGYVVFVMDNRGSADRGLEFENCTFRNFGKVEMQDQMEGVKFLRSLPYVDADRMGVHGWSFGGFMTTNLMLTHPDVFKVGVAGGPVIDWRYYEVMYGERYMDTPQENPEGYAAADLKARAGDLKGRLEIIIGMNDPTCVPQHTLSFLKACVDAGTQPDFYAYPGHGHNVMGHDRVHLHERITRYFEDHLK